MTHSESDSTSLRKTLTWRDGFAIALVIPNGLLLTGGYAIGAIGAWTAIAIWAGGAVIGLLQNMLFAETAAMFPGQSGGVSRYATEAWKRYFAPLGAVASFGYWIGWSFSIAVNAAAIGTLVQTEWLPRLTDGITVLGHPMGLSALISVTAIAAGWAFNYFGAHIGARANKITAILVCAGLAVVVFVPLFRHGGIHLHNLTWFHGGNWMTILVWFYATAWVTYGTEICASFAPEYKDTVRDTARALRLTSLLSIGVFLVVPMTMVGSVGEQAIRANPVARLCHRLRTRARGVRPTRHCAADLLHAHWDGLDHRRRRPLPLRARSRRHDDQTTRPRQQMGRPRPRPHPRRRGQQPNHSATR